MAIPGHLLNLEVTRVRPAQVGPDDLGNTTLDYGAAATRTAVSARLQQDQRTEQFPDGRQPGESQWMLFTNDPDIDRADRFEVDLPTGSVTFEVHGRPEPAYGDEYDHTETLLRLLEG